MRDIRHSFKLCKSSVERFFIYLRDVNYSPRVHFLTSQKPNVNSAKSYSKNPRSQPSLSATFFLFQFLIALFLNLSTRNYVVRVPRMFGFDSCVLFFILIIISSHIMCFFFNSYNYSVTHFFLFL